MKNKKDLFYKRDLFDNWSTLLYESSNLNDSLYWLNGNIDYLRSRGHVLINIKKYIDETDDAFDISLY